MNCENVEEIFVCLCISGSSVTSDILDQEISVIHSKDARMSQVSSSYKSLNTVNRGVLVEFLYKLTP